MSITLNSQITVLVMLANNNACGCSMLCNQIQGEHTGADLGFFVPQSKIFGGRGVVGAGRGIDLA